MKCDFCEKKATVFLTQLVDGEMKKVCLCDECAEEKGVTDPTGFSLADTLMGGTAPVPLPQPQQFAQDGSGHVCPTCGFSVEDLQKTRRFGCSDCYETFGDEVGQMLAGMHKGPEHVGKVPGGLMARQVLHRRLEDLRKSLDEAVSTEKFEVAAKLRDEIQSLEETKDEKP